MQFWKWLEKRYGHTAIMDEWRSVAGDWLPAIRPLLMPLDRRSTIYPNPRPYGQPMKVVVHSEEDVVAIDEADWQHRFSLKPEDIVLWKLDLRLLRIAICNALDDLNIARTPIEQDAPCLQIGNWEPKKAARFPVYLLLCNRFNYLRLEVTKMITNCHGKGAILITPSRVHWDDALVSLLNAHKTLLVPLCEIIERKENTFQETPAWKEYLQAFSQMIKLTLPGNYRKEKPAPMRGERATNIERLEKELDKHILAARDHAYTLKQRGQEPQLLPRPTQKELAKMLEMNEVAVCRCLRDQRAKVLKILWHTADSVEDVMRYKRR